MPISFRYLDLSEPVDLLSGMSAEEKKIIDFINQKVASAASLDELMNFFYDATRELCPCDRMSLAFVEEQGRRSVVLLFRSSVLKNAYSEEHVRKQMALMERLAQAVEKAYRIE